MSLCQREVSVPCSLLLPRKPHCASLLPPQQAGQVHMAAAKGPFKADRHCQRL